MSNRMELIVKTHDAQHLLCAPGVGVCTTHLRSGSIVGPGDVFGTLRILHTNYELIVPTGVSGKLSLDSARTVFSVQYGQTIAEIAPLEVGGALAVAATGASTPKGANFVSPMDGMFYRRSSPDVAPFVAEGDLVEPGATLGLMEVMKFFYPIRYEGRAAATILSCAIPEAAAVEAGATLFVFDR